jgi:hypothetical protein
MIDSIDDILKHGEADGLRLGAIQRHRLLRLLQRYCGAVLWDGKTAAPMLATAVVVLNSAVAPRIETLIGSLHENSIVIIPFGENPTFDFLKSKLHAYGTIGSQGIAAPHHIWWGGVKPLAVPTGLYRKEDVLFVSSCGSGLAAREKASKLVADLDRLGLDGVVDAIAPGSPAAGRAPSQVDIIIRQWELTHRPIFWIGPEARVRQHPVLPQALGCDFAVHKRRSGEMQAGALFFHQTESARVLLDAWQSLSRDHPSLPDAFLLDQAWTLVASQRQIETAWLPDHYWRAGEFPQQDRVTVIQYDPSVAAKVPEEYLTVSCQRARRFGRHQAPEAHLVMQSGEDSRRQITVLIRDVLASNAQNVSGAVEAAAQAFAANPGGFSHMELVLCAWDDDVDSVMQIEDDSWVLLTDPSERLELDAFTRLGTTLKRGGRQSASFVKRPLFQRP